MENLPSSIDSSMLMAGIILIIAYVLIFAEVIHRTSAAIIGAVIMVGVGMMGGFYSQEAAILAIDANTILLLAGMMMIVTLLQPTGGFEYVAIRLSRMAKGSPTLLLIYLSLSVSVISMFLDNVTTVLIFAPLTVLIARFLRLNPMPYLIAEAMLSNVGGIATLVGDPPNLMIGSAASIDFTTFIIHMGPPIVVVWLFTVGMLLWQFRDHLSVTTSGEVELDETRVIKDPVALKRGLLALGVIITLFFIHHHLHLYPAYATLVGVALALAIMQPDPADLFGQVHWSVLFFFAALFVIVGGVEGSGLLDLIGHSLADFARQPDMLLWTCLLLMWVAAILSAVLDNIPFTVTMIPIVQGLESAGVNITPLWWALALGVGLGGNGTHIGATANIIVVTEAERCGIQDARITPGYWIRVGVPTMILSLSVASLIMYSFFDYFI